ncbi:hypothetical protein PsorP6_007805 [Peronosclerospora sorghi]|uniref:Uncharacterized protein n=1 Tax=Peronosclerospora sorghi TaxID=230839 RepID=A0ACC0W6N3_9STRA|nr:hypothetical protein PsorP6_007805 [Peronosclerospora sorghi]
MRDTKYVVPTLLDVDKFSRFSSSTCHADKVYKTIGYGLGVMGHLWPQKETETAVGLRAIASQISMARYVIRFTEGLNAYAAWKNGSWCCSDDDECVRRLVNVQALSMIIYHPLEHLAYVGFVTPKLLNVDAMNLSRLSCRAWGVYLLLDLWANTLRIKALIVKEKQILEQEDLSDEERSMKLASIQARYVEYRTPLAYQLQVGKLCLPLL